MSEGIQIKSDGSIVRAHLEVGRVKWSVPWVCDFFGDWFSDDPAWELESKIEDLEAQAKSDQQDIGRLEDELAEALDGCEKAEKDLEHLANEVRVFLVGNDFGDIALARLREAMEGVE